MAAGQEIPHRSWNPKVHYRVHRNHPPLVHTICRMNWIHIFTSIKISMEWIYTQIRQWDWYVESLGHNEPMVTGKEFLHSKRHFNHRSLL